MNRALVAVVVGAALALAACAVEKPENRAAGKFIAHRGPLPSCGSYTLPRSDPAATVPPNKAAVDKCILDAFGGGRPAEAVVTSPDVEGSRVVTYYRVLGPGRVELIRDYRACRFGCGVPVLANECSTLRLEQNALNVDNCYR